MNLDKLYAGIMRALLSLSTLIMVGQFHCASASKRMPVILLESLLPRKTAMNVFLIDHNLARLDAIIVNLARRPGHGPGHDHDPSRPVLASSRARGLQTVAIAKVHTKQTNLETIKEARPRCPRDLLRRTRTLVIMHHIKATIKEPHP